MSYGVKYRADYDSITGITCRVEILKKDYTGDIYPLELSGSPVVQNYQTDEARPAIKGCSLTVTIHNAGSLPITTFYSVNDDEYKITHYKNGSVTFTGFLVQDDCYEDMVDYRHPIVLSANDNLGLLKDAAFGSKLPTDFIYAAEVASEEALITSSYYIFIKSSAYIPIQGKPFTITGHTDPSLNGTFTPLEVIAGSVPVFFYQVKVADVLTDIDFAPVTIDSAFNIYGRNALSEIIRLCLFNTGLNLDIYVFCNLFEQSHQTSVSCFEQTIIDAQTFLEDQSFKNCYEILELIFNRFNITLFQSNGVWNLVRWDELRYGDVNGFIYDSVWNILGTTSLIGFNAFGFEQETYPENAPIRSITRPYKFDKETFNYEQPKYLLKNYDLQDLGDLIRSYTEGSGPDIHYISEYEFTDWNPSGFTPQPEYFIRVIKDNTDTEIDRYIVVKGPTGDTSRSVISTPFEVSEGDKISLELTFKTSISQAGSINFQFAVMLTDGSTTNYADEDATVNWGISNRWLFQIASGDNSNINHSVTINPGAIPFDGLIYVYLPQNVFSPGADDETQIRDIRLTYTPYINQSTKIIGQYHLNEQDENIKNTNDETIYLDDTPRNSLKGTMFLNAFSGVLQTRTQLWYRIINDSERLRLGNITTLEELFLRRRPRTKIEGNFIGIENINMLNKIKYSPFTEFNFIFGMLEMNFKNNSCRCTLFEMFEDGEIDGNLTSEYTFKYLYNTK